MDKIFRNIWIKTNSNTDLSPEFVHTKFLCLLWTRMTWFTRPCHLLDKLKKKHIISKKLITCKLTGCYIDSYWQFFLVDHQQINHHMDQKKKTIKSRFHPFAPSFSKFRAKNSRLWSKAAASKVIICAPHFPVNYEYSGYTSLWRKQLQQWACKTAWFLKRTLFTS